MKERNTMYRKRQWHILTLTLLIAPILPLNASAAPVGRDSALRAATAELPRYFAGPWQLASEISMHNLQGETVAYTFVFSQVPFKADGKARGNDPVQFIAGARQNLTKDGRESSGDEPQLYGEEVFASIVTSADDTEPVVLRCFRGLPPQLVKQSNAIALATRKRGGEWHYRQHLMLGLFDEALLLESPDGKTSLVVDMRTRSVLTQATAKKRALRKTPVKPGAEQVRQCQEAWAPYRSSGSGEAVTSAPTAPKTTRLKRAEIDEAQDYGLFLEPQRENKLPLHRQNREGLR